MDEQLRKNILYDLQPFLFWLKIRSKERNFTLSSKKVRTIIEEAAEILAGLEVYCYYTNQEEIIEIYAEKIPSVKKEHNVESIFIYVTESRLDLGIKFLFEIKSHYTKIADRR